VLDLLKQNRSNKKLHFHSEGWGCDQDASSGFIYGLYAIINGDAETDEFFVPFGYYFW